MNENNIIIIMISFAICVIMGCVTERMNRQKGYKNGFAWGFWLNIIGIIVIACRPFNNMKGKIENSTKADEIIKYKGLLESGAITQEEYEKLKKQILDS